ncbi:MAG TPA: hypothetical protein VJP79_04050 [Nitrososphaera sp.]|jgi:hypothetical protein|nr:hypothetical protein [Nitrososphaera sp.]
MQGGSDAEGTVVRSNTGREFSVQNLFFQNGCFLIIFEGEPRIGAISASISASGGKANTAKVIPSKYDSIFINTVSEKVSSMINGICLVSLHNKVQLDLDDMKAIMGVVMDIVEKRRDNSNEGQNSG